MFFSQEEEQHTKEDFYFAQIAAEIRRGMVKVPKDVKVEDFLVRIKLEEPEQPTTEDRKEHSKKSKSSWLSIFGKGKNKS